MKTISFHIETGMLQAVKDGTKTQTFLTPSKRSHKVGDVLAVTEPFWITPFTPEIANKTQIQGIPFVVTEQIDGQSEWRTLNDKP